MNKTMNNWSQQQLINWVNTLSSISQSNKQKIIDGINDFSASGQDVFDVDKDDLHENFEITRMLAGKLFQAIQEKRGQQFKYNQPGYTSSPEGGVDFNVNLTGQKGAFCTIGKLKSSYTVKYLKERYLDYYGHDFKNKDKFNTLKIRRMNTVLQDDKTLSYYHIFDDTITLTVTFRVNGGSDVNNTNSIDFVDSYSNQIGSVHQQNSGINHDEPMDIDVDNAEIDVKQQEQKQMDIDEPAEKYSATSATNDDSQMKSTTPCSRAVIPLNANSNSDSENSEILKINKRPKDDISDNDNSEDMDQSTHRDPDITSSATSSSSSTSNSNPENSIDSNELQRTSINQCSKQDGHQTVCHNNNHNTDSMMPTINDSVISQHIDNELSTEADIIAEIDAKKHTISENVCSKPPQIATINDDVDYHKDDIDKLLRSEPTLMEKISEFAAEKSQTVVFIIAEICTLVWLDHIGLINDHDAQCEIDNDLVNEAKDKFKTLVESHHNVEEKVDIGRNKTFDQIPMNRWKSCHIKCWVQSLGGPFPKKCDKFKNMSGKQLIDINIDDLSLFLSSKMQRRKFMEHLEKAKEKYNILTQDCTTSSTKVNGIVGLNNMGNTCFMNTCIQLLSQTPILARFLAKRAMNLRLNGHSIYKRMKHKQSPMLDAWTQLCDVIYNQSNIKSFRPTKIRNALHRIDNDFGLGQQDDSARALNVILNALDQEIENEMNTKKHLRHYMDFYEITDGEHLDENTLQEQMIVEELLRKHNPQNSIIRKLFDGVERVIYTCYDKKCGFKYRQYRIFRMLQIPVFSNKITFLNITVVNKDKYVAIHRVSALDYCSIDVLKHKIIQNLKSIKIQNKLNIDVTNIDIEDIEIMNMQNNGYLEIVHSSTTLSDLQNCAVNIFALIHENRSQHSTKINILQFIVDDTAKRICYRSWDEDKIDEYIQTVTKNYPRSEYKFLFNCNGMLFNDPSMITKESTKNVNYMLIGVHMLKNENQNSDSLSFNFQKHQPVLCLVDNKWCSATIDSMLKDEVYVRYDKFDDIQKISDWIPQREWHWRIKSKPTVDKDFEYLFTSLQTRTEGPTELNDLNECLREYQHQMSGFTVDQSRFSYKCRGCGKQCKLLRLQKDIIQTPPILILHLDRFGKNMSNVNTKQTQKKRSGHSSYFVSHKFDHAVQYKTTLNIGNNDKTYQLFGVSNHSKKRSYKLYGISKHSGTTSFGHYTANVKCLSDNNWYDISDSHVHQRGNAGKGNQRAATILMYSGTDTNL